MTRLERVLIPVVVLFLALTVAACIYQGSNAESISIDGQPPLSVVLSQVGIFAAPILATVAFASIAGLVFLRAIRWRR